MGSEPSENPKTKPPDTAPKPLTWEEAEIFHMGISERAICPTIFMKVCAAFYFVSEVHDLALWCSCDQLRDPREHYAPTVL